MPHTLSSSSIDSTYNIRRNPLNMRNVDGSDLMLDKHSVNLNQRSSTNNGNGNNDIVVSQGFNAHRHRVSKSLSVPNVSTYSSPTDAMIDYINDKHDLGDDDLISPVHGSRLHYKQKQQHRHSVQETKVTKRHDFPRTSSLNDDSSSEISDITNTTDNFKLQLNIGTPYFLESSVMESYTNLSLPTNLNEVKNYAKNGSADNNSLSLSIMSQEDDPGLVRKNTITSSDKSAGRPEPSESQHLFQRLRKVREKVKKSEKGSKVELSRSDSHLVQKLTPVLSQNSRGFNRKNIKPSLPFSVSSESSQSDEDSSIYTGGQYTPSMNDGEFEGSENGSLIYQSSTSGSDVDMLSPETDTEIERLPIDVSDRGRLFLKINGLKELRLPLDMERNPRFMLTLDNSIQSVTTCAMPFKDGIIMSEINQEFELVVGEDLQLVMTLSAIMDPKKPPKDLADDSIRDSPSTSLSRKKRFGIFGSPKKEKVKDLQQNLEMEGSNIWANLTGPRGEFARAYILHSDIEPDIYGVAQVFNLSCYNEWATQTKIVQQPLPAVDKRKSNSQATRYVKHQVRLDPYHIGGLEVSMVYIPRAYRDEVLPSSLESCVKEIEHAMQKIAVDYNGFLSQQGGDCSYWRRRWFELQGSKLRGHHEESRKVRCTINLEEVEQVADDMCYGEQYSFRMRMRNGDIINFMADSVKARKDWVRHLNSALTYSVGRARTWTDMIAIYHRQGQERRYCE